MDVCGRCGLPHPAERPCPIATGLLVSPPADLLPAGTVVASRYRIVKPVHRSGMSTVYQAEDLRNRGTVVALKEFNAGGLPGDERAEALRWLAREAGLLSLLHDARLPSLLGSASEGDRHFIAMPFIVGETLEERIKREGPLPEDCVFRLGLQLAELLAYLHGQEPPIIHRDLKPANLLLRGESDVILLDLGVARPLQRGVSGTAVGTPGYAAPEQYQGLADERSDLYALGATLHRALTGYDPDQEAPFRHPPVRDLNPAVSGVLADLVDRLLRIVPAERPQTAALVLDRLRDLPRQIEEQRRQIEKQRLRPLHRMRRWAVACAAAAALLSAAVCAVAFRVPMAGNVYRLVALSGDHGKVAMVFAPWLLLFLPLLRDEFRAFAWGTPQARGEYVLTLATLPLLGVWVAAFWEIALLTGQIGAVVLTPGYAAACLWSAAMTGVLALAYTVSLGGRLLSGKALAWHTVIDRLLGILGASVLAVVLACRLGLPGSGAHQVTSVAAPSAWQVPLSGYTLHGVACAGTTDCVAVGDSGIIRTSMDGGAIWRSLFSGTDADLNAVACPQPTLCVAVGATVVAGPAVMILRRSNGSAPWSARLVYCDAATSDLTGVAFAGSRRGWAVDRSGAVLRTTDGGATWQRQAVVESPDPQVPANATTSIQPGVESPDSQHVWVVGQGSGSAGVIQSSTNDGIEYWTTSEVDGTGVWSTVGGDDAGQALNSVALAGDQHGWVVGDQGTILVKVDQGLIWQSQASGTFENLESVAFPDSTHGWVVGDAGTILHTTDGGLIWQSQASGTRENLESVAFPDTTHGVAVGQNGAILRTTNGGATWAST